MCDVKHIVFKLFLICQIITFSVGKPLFLNHTFITSLLGASSSPSQGFDENPYSENIAIVPSNKSSKLQQNIQEYQENSFIFPEEADVTVNFDITTTTEGSSLLKKKVEKIIRKFVTVAQIKQAVSGKLQDDSGFQYPSTSDMDTKEIKISKEYGQPLKIDLTKNAFETEDNSENADENNTKNDEKVAHENFGIFILELFASLVGLTIGAATQIQHSFSQNNTVQN